jgi:HD-GYP domain-containing protein (c-di-GMP phosphodiesterase class II)
MSHLFPVEFEQELLVEFNEGLEQIHQDVERLVITLEQSPDDIHLVDTVTKLFDELAFSSTKLALVPISESLQETIKCLELIQEFNKYPVRMSEFTLLVIDRVLGLSRDIQRNFVIDIRKTQHILVALQHVILVKDVAQLEAGVEKAIKAITQDIYDNLDNDTEDESNVLLFDDSVELFDDTENPLPDNDPLNIEIFIPEESINPVLQAREYVTQELDGKPIMLLAKISDLSTRHGDSHTLFLLELSLAINMAAGNPIDMTSLAMGICAHDIALSSIPYIVNKKERLTKEEFDQIKMHPVQGAELIKEFSNASAAVEVVLQHHERIDGKGYPYGLKGDYISDAGKLVAIVDSFHGMMHHRPHKKYTKTLLRAVAEINACVDTQFDRQWVVQFNNCIRKYWLPMRNKLN